MKALTWHGKGDMRCESVPDPRIEHPRDAIIKVTACAICGSDLHIYDGVIPSMESGDVLGHETMGEVVEVGSENTRQLKVGDRVVVPFTIACGECFFCQRGYFSGCERSNPNAAKAAKLWGHSPAGLFGYSHLLGGFPAGRRNTCGAVRRRRPDQGAGRDVRRTGAVPLRHLPDRLHGAPSSATSKAARRSRCGAAARWRSSPSAAPILLGAGRVIAIDTVPERLRMAEAAGATRSTS